jgi:uncharacterized protein (TIGR02145 family)
MIKQNTFLVYRLIVTVIVFGLATNCRKPESAIIFTEDVPISDCDGNTYKTVKIGNQIWMAENLRTTRYSNGDAIPQVASDTNWAKLTDGAYCWYNNDVVNKINFGALYNWFSVQDSRNIAPTGWHIPTDAEWTILETYLGGVSVAGGKMKSPAIWQSPNTGSDNSSGFSAFPGGYRNGVYGTYEQINIQTYWWSATEYDLIVLDVKSAWFRVVGYDYTAINRTTINERSGFSLRCIKDNN